MSYIDDVIGLGLSLSLSHIEVLSFVTPFGEFDNKWVVVRE